MSKMPNDQNNMEDGYIKIDPASFVVYAGDDISKWRLLIRCWFDHCSDGIGVVKNIISYSDKPPSITVGFESKRRRQLIEYSAYDLKNDRTSEFLLPTHQYFSLLRPLYWKKIKQHLDVFDLNSAEAIFIEIKHLLSNDEIEEYHLICEQINQKLEIEARKKAKIEKLRKLLTKHFFEDADDLYVKFSAFLPENEYELLKQNYLISYFQQQLNIEISEEQSQAITKLNKNILLKARAGSGKTRVLACKTGLLIDRYGINPDQIIILAFNKKAATEIGNRIRRKFGFESFENARTFHSLAYQLVQPKGKILFDQAGEFARHELSIFVQGILRDIWNSAFQTKLYELFRREMASIEYSGALLNKADYCAYIRSRRDITLGGDRVKSHGEKFIADFLFEHDISYAYEKVEFWSGHNYRPDFFIHNKGRDYVVEFWGIDENDPNKEIPIWWDVSWDQYYQQLQEKRAYWFGKGIPLIELSVVALRDGRVSFERILKSYLENAGITCKKLPKEVIQNKVIRNQKDRMSDLFVQFIQKAKKGMLSAEDMQNKADEYCTNDNRTRVFLELACRVYKEYETKLKNQNLIDFDQLLLQAAELVQENEGECSISLGYKKDRQVKMKDLKWILIDEYQDFSRLFFNLLSAIRVHNPGIKMMCVGDDWQAINSFAGSDLHFFYDFKSMLSSSGISHLQTNYRSQKQIVEAGNILMAGLGMPGIALSKNNSGEVNIRTIDDIWIETRKEESYVEACQNDQRFIFYEKRADGNKMNDNGFLQAKYLKACYQIITHPENMSTIASLKGKEKDQIGVAILSRTNRLYRVTLKEFLFKLRNCFAKEELSKIGDFHQKIRVGTVHSFKGLEADIVIILRAVRGAFPLIHPDNALFSIFGQTEKDLLDEERRLFYVALTRAKEKLYILTEKDRQSDFLDQVDLSISKSLPG